MKRLALVLLLVCSTVSATEESDDISSDEWRFVCRALGVMGYKVQCRNIKPPTVVVSKIVHDLAPPGTIMYGVTYDDEPYIFVNARMTRGEQRAIVIHEATHYVLWQTYGMAVGRCEGESAARTVHRMWQNLPPDDSWRSLYDC
jgi:hypothetical protein